MKKLLYIFSITISATLTSHAQIKVWDNETYFDHEKSEVVVKLKVEARNIDGTIAMDFVIRDGKGNARTLPAIVYASPARYWHTIRSGKTPWVYRSKKLPVTTDYTAQIPYEEWMDHAQLSANRVRYEKCGEWLVGTQTIVNDIMVTPYLKVEITPEPKIWQPDPALYTRMVGFITPDVEGVKRRVATVKLHISYPVNVHRVVPTYMNNFNELPKVDAMMNELLNNNFIVINSYRITGYASPEGRYRTNEALAKNRSMGFKNYILSKYPTQRLPIHNDWVAEDWNGLVHEINDREMSYKEEILNIIASTDIFDGREKLLMELGGGFPYKEMLVEIFPKLRRIEFRADYTVSSFTDDQAKDLIYTRPELLSLDEMYRVALSYKPGTQEYRKVYEIAAKHFPQDVIANNNAAAAILLEGDADAAKVYIEKIKNDTRSYINRGVIAYIDGDLDTAKEYFRITSKDGDKTAIRNLELLENTEK